MLSRLISVRNIAALAVAALFVSGCSQDEVTAPRSAETIFESAMNKFRDEDYQEAYEEFRILTLQYPGSQLADDAQFHMGESKFLRGEYILAAFEYDVLVRSMPTSELVPNARFKSAMCYYESSRPFYLEQESTRKAIDAFQAFIEYHPTDARVPDAEVKIREMNTRLARKEFEGGLIYMKMEYYRAAVVSFDHVLEKYHDTEFAEPAYFRKGEALYYRKRYQEAADVLRRFLERYPTSSLREEAQALLLDAGAQAASAASAASIKSPADSIRSRP